MTNKPACKTGGAKIVAYLSRALFLAELLDRYHPERHYMRGPGPKWLAKHTRQNESRRRSTCRVIDRCDARDGSRLGDNQLVRAAFEPTLMMAPAKTFRVRPRWIIRGLGAILTVVCMFGRLQIAAAEESETAQDIIATQIRSQGYRRNYPKTVVRDADASEPDEYAWRLQCEQRSYLVRLIPHRAAKVERVGQ
jgi:hypothetical protein